MILMIDNYDSFTYNLVQYLEILEKEVEVVRNDRMETDAVDTYQPEAIVLSPGPCTPDCAGISVPLVEKYSGTYPILGVCLGLQSIALAFGGQIRHAKHIMHGKVSKIKHDREGMFNGIKSPFPATRYHSLSVDEAVLPACLRVSARAEDDDEIMGLRHTSHPTVGIQFHPESILTPSGKRLLSNFLKTYVSGKET